MVQSSTHSLHGYLVAYVCHFQQSAHSGPPHAPIAMLQTLADMRNCSLVALLGHFDNCIHGAKSYLEARVHEATAQSSDHVRVPFASEVQHGAHNGFAHVLMLISQAGRDHRDGSSVAGRRHASYDVQSRKPHSQLLVFQSALNCAQHSWRPCPSAAGQDHECLHSSLPHAGIAMRQVPRHLDHRSFVAWFSRAAKSDQRRTLHVFVRVPQMARQRLGNVPISTLGKHVEGLQRRLMDRLVPVSHTIGDCARSLSLALAPDMSQSYKTRTPNVPGSLLQVVSNGSEGMLVIAPGHLGENFKCCPAHSLFRVAATNERRIRRKPLTLAELTKRTHEERPQSRVADVTFEQLPDG
mmetsp:Transcript_66586/g.185639  ORF Transcript_66586/g.185639 Transcript_66586/m.185639 type:complete len:353 (+) Transcript_66586:400-1458(+)